MQTNLQAQRVNLSYFLTFGRNAKLEELRYWQGRTESRNWEVRQFVDNHAAWFATPQGNVELEATILRATEAAWGKSNLYRTTPQGTVYARYNRQIGRSWRTYVDLVNALTEEMDRDKRFKESVVRQSYADAAIVPSSSDVYGWVNGLGSKKPYILMLAEHLIWKAGKQGKSTAGLTRTPVGVAAEGLKVNNANMVAAGGGNMVAAGGGNMVAAGGGNIMAFGGNRIIPMAGSSMVQLARAIPLIGMDGSTLVGLDGGTLVGNDGASLVRVDAASLIRR
ncbi:MAG: hypothetical protein QM758_04250 [Armatimonas sp.]